MGLQGNKFKEAEEIFQSLLDEEKSPLKPDQKMFHMMIYMYRKAGSYENARKIFGLMRERGVPQSSVTYNSLMSFEGNYKEVSKMYDQVIKLVSPPSPVLSLQFAIIINFFSRGVVIMF